MNSTEDRRPPKPATSVVAAERARRLAKPGRSVPRSIVVETPAAVTKVGSLYASVERFVNLPVVDRYLVPAVRSSPNASATPAAL